MAFAEKMIVTILSVPMYAFFGTGCGDPPVPAHGSVILTSSGDIVARSTATQSCDRGYQVTGGDGNIVCNGRGSWMHTITCTKVIDCGSAPKPTHGTVRLKKAGQTFYLSTAIQSCKNGYKMVTGTGIITCQSNGKWSKSITCLKASTRSRSTCKTRQTFFRSTATQSCSNGYVMVTGTGTITCRCNGKWSASITCVINCGKAPKPAHGTVRLAKSGQTFYRSTATQSCSNGYVMVTGTGTITCLSNGKWSKSITCLIDCGKAPKPAYGTVRLAKSGQTFYKSAAKQSCNNGYVIVTGDGTIKCLSNGKWSKSITCLRDCGDAPKPVHGTVRLAKTEQTFYRSTATQSCNSGYKRVTGTGTIKCLSNGRWSTSITCLIDCGTAPKPSHGTVRLSKNGQTFYRSTATQSCNNGYEMVTGTGTIKCLVNGKWSSSITCLIDCGSPPKPRHGVVRLANINHTYYGATAFQSCKIGYESVHDTNTVTIVCQASGNWSSSIICFSVMIATTMSTSTKMPITSMKQQVSTIPSTNTNISNTIMTTFPPRRNTTRTRILKPTECNVPNSTRLPSESDKNVQFNSTLLITETFLIPTVEDKQKTTLSSHLTQLLSFKGIQVSGVLSGFSLTTTVTFLSLTSTDAVSKETALFSKNTLSTVFAVQTKEALMKTTILPAKATLPSTRTVPTKLRSPTNVTMETASTVLTTFLPQTKTVTTVTSTLKSTTNNTMPSSTNVTMPLSATVSATIKMPAVTLPNLIIPRTTEMLPANISKQTMTTTIIALNLSANTSMATLITVPTISKLPTTVKSPTDTFMKRQTMISSPVSVVMTAQSTITTSFGSQDSESEPRQTTIPTIIKSIANSSMPTTATLPTTIHKPTNINGSIQPYVPTTFNSQENDSLPSITARPTTVKLPAITFIQTLTTMKKILEFTTGAITQATNVLPTPFTLFANTSVPTSATQSITTSKSSQGSLKSFGSSYGKLGFFNNPIFVGGVTSAVGFVILIPLMACLYKAYAKRTKVFPEIDV